MGKGGEGLGWYVGPTLRPRPKPRILLRVDYFIPGPWCISCATLVFRNMFVEQSEC